ncbi:hypothetical protein LH51_08635 [Nitrincola sp. A-D6]|uniref:MarR family winged helix-turn-helix transcriptional regulator n=1 Tax=Nitrincola sp. A-D6 TaxID=1545442 RepID=UPI00051FE76B|nr:MarR family transcriptional regulator [Nitrincola sp. A-D6]KGK42288.1 hypothetical protein LH51_08635 [Nitrincola sp. A-D6]
MKDKHVLALIKVANVLREIKVDLPLTQLHVLLTVIREEGLSARDIEKRVGQPKSSVTRNIRVLTERASAERKGLGLCEYRCDTADIRVKNIYLTEEGKQIARKLEEVLDRAYL